MKAKNQTLLCLLSLTFGSLAYSGRYHAHADSDPMEETQRVTAFTNTKEGLKVECWEIGHFLPSHSDSGSTTVLPPLTDLMIRTFPPTCNILFTLDNPDGPEANAIDFGRQPNLFTVKDGLIFIEATTAMTIQGSKNPASYVFADVNGDDWFYFEDQDFGDESGSARSCSTPKSKKNRHDSSTTFTARTISGSDTTLINFVYDATPKHKVIHEGRCNFAGLKPIPNSGRDFDAEKLRVQS